MFCLSLYVYSWDNVCFVVRTCCELAWKQIHVLFDIDLSVQLFIFFPSKIYIYIMRRDWDWMKWQAHYQLCIVCLCCYFTLKSVVFFLRNPSIWRWSIDHCSPCSQKRCWPAVRWMAIRDPARRSMLTKSTAGGQLPERQLFCKIKSAEGQLFW